MPCRTMSSFARLRCTGPAHAPTLPHGSAVSFAAVLGALLAFILVRPAAAQPVPPCGPTTTIACGETAEATIASVSLTTADCYTFDADAGEVVSIGVARQNGVHIDPAWVLIDSLGTTIDFSCNGENRACRSTAALSGTPPYTIKIYDFGQNDAGQYNLTLEPLSATFDGVPSCATPLLCGAPADALVTHASDLDTYVIDANAGEVIAVGVSRSLSGFISPAWSLYDAAGTLVDGSCEIDAASCQNVVTLTGPAPYLLAVADFGIDNPGGYSVTVQGLSATFGGAPSCADAIGCGGTEFKSLTHNSSIEAYRFAAAAGESVVIGVARESGGELMPAWELYDAAGALVDASCSIDAPGCRAHVTLTGNSPYTIKINDFELRVTGDASVSLDPGSATFDAVPGCAAALACGTTATDAVFANSDSDTYRFTGAPGDAVLVTVARETGGLLTPDWSIYDAGGMLVGSPCSTPNAVCQQSIALAGASPYTLVIGDDGLRVTGGYSVSLHGVSGGGGCASPIACGVAAAGALTERADADTYSFATASGDRLTITVARTSGTSLLPHWELFAVDGTPLGSCSTATAACTETVTLGEPGPYTLAVSHIDLGSGGNYSVDVTSNNCCTVAADCVGANVCRMPSCDGSGFCPVIEGIPCDDAVACTAGDTCAAGTCAGVDACPPGRTCDAGSGLCIECIANADCDDANACTDDVCSAPGDCSNAPIAGLCDDGIFCNGADACSGGSCSLHAGDPCLPLGDCNDTCNEAARTCLSPAGTPCTDDGSVCTDDLCSVTGICTHPAVDGGPCDDGKTCTTADTCSAGLCLGTVPPVCIDGDPCTLDSCDDIAGCLNSAEPLAECKVAGRIELKVRDRPVNFGDRLTWKWQRGEQTLIVEYGDPAAATSYSLCVFDTVAGSLVHATTLQIPADGELWRDNGPKKGWLYADKRTENDGVRRMRLKPGGPGKARIEVIARGPSLPTPVPVGVDRYFSQDPDVVVQLLSSDGKCWTSSFAEPARTDTGNRFGDRR